MGNENGRTVEERREDEHGKEEERKTLYVNREKEKFEGSVRQG